MEAAFHHGLPPGFLIHTSTIDWVFRVKQANLNQTLCHSSISLKSSYTSSIPAVIRRKQSDSIRRATNNNRQRQSRWLSGSDICRQSLSMHEPSNSNASATAAYCRQRMIHSLACIGFLLFSTSIPRIRAHSFDLWLESLVLIVIIGAQSP